MEIKIEHSCASLICQDKFSAIMALDAKYFDWPWTAAAWEALGSDYHLSWLQVDGQLMGFCLFAIGPLEQVAHLLKIVIMPIVRSRGLGKMLLEQSVKALPAEFVNIYLEVAESNQVAVNFYQKMGFKKLHHKKNYYSDGSNAYALSLQRKDLSI